MQSTGHTSTHARSLTPMQASTITYVMPLAPRQPDAERDSMVGPMRTQGAVSPSQEPEGHPARCHVRAREPSQAREHEIPNQGVSESAGDPVVGPLDPQPARRL